MKQKIIAQGAEAFLIQKDNKLIKRRLPKGYRHPELDKKIIEGRTRKEAKMLEKAGKLLNTPKILSTTKTEITMEFINGKKLSESLDKLPLKKAIDICYKLGENVAILHNNNLIHGDLTTSNLILKSGKNLKDFRL